MARGTASAGPLAGRVFSGEPEIDGFVPAEPESVLDCRAPGYGDELRSRGTGRPVVHGIGAAGPDRRRLTSKTFRADRCARTTARSVTRADAATAAPTDRSNAPTIRGRTATRRPTATGVGARTVPESLNPAMSCTNGNRDGEIRRSSTIAAPAAPKSRNAPACQQSDTVGCPKRLLGLLVQRRIACRSGEDLGANKSRANLLPSNAVSTPKPAPNPEYKTYCCFMPGARARGRQLRESHVRSGVRGGQIRFRLLRTGHARRRLSRR